MKKHNVKNNKNMFIISLIAGIFLMLFVGIIIGNIFLNNSNSYFARIRVAIKKKVQIVYNYNLFDANNDALKEYNKDTKTLVIDGNLNSNNNVLGSLDNMSFKKGDRYRVTINYISGSYTNNPQFVFELQKDNEYYTDRKNGTHYIANTLPTKGITYDRVITIKEDTKDANGFNYRIYEDNEVTFNNYKIQILITKLESKIGVAGEKYGKLPTPEKDGYEFLGWYDSISGGKKITETNTILKKYNHPLYAHWEKKINDYTKVNYTNFKWTYYSVDTGPIKKYTSDKVYSYAIWTPEDIKDLNGISLPTIIWLHGAGEMGNGNPNDENKLLDSGLLKVMTNWKQYKLEPVPAIIVAPQSPSNWGTKLNYDTIKALLNYVEDTYHTDTTKRVLMGHSRGGRGVVHIAYKYQDLNLYAAIPLSGGELRYDYDNNIVVKDDGKQFFSKLKIRGYGETSYPKAFFEWIGKPNEFIYYSDWDVPPYPAKNHGKVPERAMTTDSNKNGTSDLVEWLFGDYKNSN
jgi:uncharacterized repeat protein (TIGR02543 family)